MNSISSENRKRTSIRKKLIRLFLIMGIFPSLLVMSIMYFGVSANLERQIGNNLKMLAVETSLRVHMFLQNKVDNVLKYSSYSTLKRIFFDGDYVDHAGEFIRSLFKFDPDLYNITLINRDKKLLFSYRPNLYTIDRLEEWWDKAEQLSSREVFMFIEMDEGTEKKLLHIVTALLSDVTGKRLGLMVTSFELSSLIRMIETIPLSNRDFISLVDQSGTVLADTRKTRNPVKRIDIQILNFFKNDSGWVMGYDPQEESFSIFGYSSISSFFKDSLKGDLTVFISKRKEEAFRPIALLMLKLLAFCLAVVFLILLVFIFRIEGIWKPVLSLKKGAEMIGEGNFDMVLFIPTGDELEDLADSFNKMGKKLKISHNTLEAQNKKLIELNDVKNNFVSMVSHELRTPLMIIREALSQILEGLKGEISEEQREFLSMAHRNTHRLNQIIQDLLSISKIEKGKLEFHRNKSDLVTILQNEVQNHKIKSDERKILIKENFPEKSFEIYCDPEKIQMVVTNLLGNAIKFTPEGKGIIISFYSTREEVTVCVCDQGPGIPPHSLKKVFERFVRLNPSPLIGAPSTGLGLAIAKELVEMHDGKIWAESDGVNGTSLFFTLPRYYGEEYLKIYFNDRIIEASDREIDLTVFYFRLGISSAIQQDKMKRILSGIKKLTVQEWFERLEVISFEDTFEIYVFSFTDSGSAVVIDQKIRELLNQYLNENDLSDTFVKVAYSTLGVHGKNQEELLKHLKE